MAVLWVGWKVEMLAPLLECHSVDQSEALMAGLKAESSVNSSEKTSAHWMAKLMAG